MKRIEIIAWWVVGVVTAALLAITAVQWWQLKQL